MDVIGPLISKVIGYTILLGAFGLKLPQIMNIVRNKSVAGFSAISLYIDVPLVMTHVIYNFVKGSPFQSYGENVLILVQNLILVAMFWVYNKEEKITTSNMILVLVVFAFIAYFCFSIPEKYQVIIFKISLCSSISLTVATFG